MSIKRLEAGGYNDVLLRQRWNGSQWVAMTLGRRWDGGKWVDLWNGKTVHTRVYGLSSAQIYWNSGVRDNQQVSASDLILGTYTGAQAQSRRTLLFFPMGTVMSDLSDSVIYSVQLYLRRVSTPHGAEQSTAHVRSGPWYSAPETWNGSGCYDAALYDESFARGEGKWVTLSPVIAEAMRDGSLGCLALDAQSNVSLSGYGRFSRGDTQLKITYLK